MDGARPAPILYQHIQRLVVAEHSSRTRADLTTRMTSDISAIRTSSIRRCRILVNVLTLPARSRDVYINCASRRALSITPVLFLCHFYTRGIKQASRAVRRRNRRCSPGSPTMLTSIHVVRRSAGDYETGVRVGKPGFSSKSGCRPRHEGEAVTIVEVCRRARHVPVLATAAARAGGRISPGV